MSRVIVISNRVVEPRRAAQAGGVAVAISDILRRREGLWFGWDGKIVAENCPEAAKVNNHRTFTTVTGPMTRHEHEDYYLGYSNAVLWPVFHNRLDLAQFEAGYFAAYAAFNARMARQLLPHIAPDDLIWVHDYQLIPMAEELRKLGVRNRIGFFLHISFPPAQTFLAVPEQRQLTRSLSAYDLIGLQTRGDVAQFLDFINSSGQGCLLSDGTIRLLDRRLAVASFPVGIDPTAFLRLGGETRGPASNTKMLRIIGVDRLDYSKGLPQKFRAFSRFLDQAPQYHGKVVLTQIAPPTRELLQAYADIRAELESLTGGVNGRLGDLEWVPIHYIHRTVARNRLAEIYQTSRVALITPLRDGMNLVAKEYVAAQDVANPGVLILSRFAGAAEEMAAALVVNPYDVEEVAQAIRTAIEMKLEERRERHLELRERILRHDAAEWGRSFLERLRDRTDFDHSDRLLEPLRQVGSKVANATPDPPPPRRGPVARPAVASYNN